MSTTNWLCPSYYIDKIKLDGEEDAAIWLWADPSLLSWPVKVEWLFSPVVGNNCFGKNRTAILV